MKNRENNAIYTSVPIEDIEFYKKLEHDLKIQNKTNEALDRENQDLFNKIDKAIEYIENRYDYEQNILMYTFDRDNLKELYEILKGDSNE